MGHRMFLAAVVIAAPAVSGFAGDDLDPDVYEPDNDANEATALELDATQTGHSIHFHTVNPVGPDTFDTDFVRFTLSAPTAVLLDTPDAIGYPRVVAAMPISLFDDGVQPIGDAAPLRVESLPAGDYFAAITSAEVFETSSVVPWYGILARDAQLPDRFEDDDTFDSARYIPYGGDGQAHNFHEDGDIDWLTYSVGTGGAGQTTIEVTPIGAGAYPIVSLFADHGGSLEILVPSLVSNGIHLYFADPATTYYIRIDNPETGRSVAETYYYITVFYTFYVSGTPAPGTIAGIVTDGQAPISGATVRVPSLPAVTVVTNAEGVYYLPNLPAATYTAAAKKPGYVANSAAVAVSRGAISQLNLALDAAAPTDFNEDGAVDAVDIQFVINAVLGLVEGGDVNGDTSANSVDIQLVINAALGL